MKAHLTAFCLAAGLLGSPAFAVTQYDFSYTWALASNSATHTTEPVGTYSVYGTFWGTANGDLITGLSNIFMSMTYNGTTLVDDASTLAMPASNHPQHGATMSFSGASNDFFLTPITTPANSFFFVSIGSMDADNGDGSGLDFFQSGSGAGSPVFYDAIDKVSEPSSWSVQAINAVTPVPEPETYALLGLGLVALCAASRRKLRTTQPEHQSLLIAQ